MDTDTATAIEALKLFNEKADKLESLDFTKVLLTESLDYHVKYDPKKGAMV